MNYLSIAQVAAEQKRLDALLDKLVANNPEGDRIRQILAIGTDDPSAPNAIYDDINNPLIKLRARVIAADLYSHLLGVFKHFYFEGETFLGPATTTVQIMSYFWGAWEQVYSQPHTYADLHHTVAMASKAAFIEIAAQRRPKDFNLVTVPLFDLERQDAMHRAWLEFWERNNIELLEQFQRYFSYLLIETKRELSALAEKSELGPKNLDYINLIQAYLTEHKYVFCFNYEEAFNELSEHIESLVDKQIKQNHPEMSYSERFDLKDAATEVFYLLENSWKNLYGDTKDAGWKSFAELGLPIESFENWKEED